MKRAKQIKRLDGEQGSYWVEVGNKVGNRECLDNGEWLTFLSIEWHDPGGVLVLLNC